MHVAKATTRVCARWLSDGPVHSELLDRVVGGLGRALVEMCPVLPAAPPIHACVLFGDYLFFRTDFVDAVAPTRRRKASWTFGVDPGLGHRLQDAPALHDETDDLQFFFDLF